MRATVTLLATAALLLLAAGCNASPVGLAPAPPAAVAPNGAAAVVNGRAIPQSVYEVQFQAAQASLAQQQGVDARSPEVQAALRHQVLEWLIDQAIIDQAAERLGIVVGEAAVSVEVERVRQQNPGQFAEWLRANGFTEESFRLQARSDLLGAAVRDRVTKDVGGKVEQVRLRQILVEQEAQAQAVLDQLREGSTFEEAARKHSIDEATRAQGGDLGFLPRGTLPESVEQVAFALAPGQVAGPVHSIYGWHILRLEAREAAREVTPDLLVALQQGAFLRWLDGERSGATIERFTE